MIFITGGTSQGKLAFAKNAFSLSEDDSSDGGDCAFSTAFDRRALNRLHLLVDRMLEAGVDPERAIEEGVARNPGIILICDELGCGVVPADAHARELRERVGRNACTLAGRASEVYRVVCGIPQKLKGAEQ